MTTGQSYPVVIFFEGVTVMYTSSVATDRRNLLVLIAMLVIIVCTLIKICQQVRALDSTNAEIQVLKHQVNDNDKVVLQLHRRILVFMSSQLKFDEVMAKCVFVKKPTLFEIPSDSD